jgi:hypothetical protein
MPADVEAIYRIIYHELTANGRLITRTELAERLNTTVGMIRKGVSDLWDDGRLYRFTIIPTSLPFHMRPSKLLQKRIDEYNQQKNKNR